MLKGVANVWRKSRRKNIRWLGVFKRLKGNDDHGRCTGFGLSSYHLGVKQRCNFCSRCMGYTSKKLQVRSTTNEEGQVQWCGLPTASISAQIVEHPRGRPQCKWPTKEGSSFGGKWITGARLIIKFHVWGARLLNSKWRRVGYWIRPFRYQNSSPISAK